MTFLFKKDYVLLAFDLWWLLLVVLVNAGVNSFQILNITAFISLSLVPGMLSLIAMQLKGFNLWGYLSLSVAFSLFWLMLFSLVGNALLPFAGIEHPLENPFLLGTISVGVVALAFMAWRRAEDVLVHIPLRISMRPILLALAPILLVCMSVMGAITLNNGGSALISVVMLALCALYLWQLARASNTVSSDVVATGLYFVSLSLLLMTSLRGWYITGHDIQRESLVFELTKMHGLWSINYLKDAYNACISITLLPSIFSTLLSLQDPYVYKIVFQMLFATVPPTLFLLVRRYVSAPFALSACIYFVAFPTFFGDMPFLNRQEIAFIFLVSMFYILFEESVSLRLRRRLFVLLGLGMILSHYSTTYTVLGALILLMIGQWSLPFVRKILKKRFITAHTSLEGLQNPYQVRITFGMVALLMCASFLWSGVLTDTSSNSLYRVIEQTFAVIAKNSKQDAQSQDVLYGLFSWHQVDPQQQLALYDQEAQSTRERLGQDQFVDSRVVARYPITLAIQQPTVLSPFGSVLLRLGINVPSFNYVFKQATAKLLQIAILVGFFVALLSRRFTKNLLHAEYWFMGGASVAMLLAIVLLPVLSVEYGLLRAFLQSLMFLGVFVVMGTVAFVRNQQRAAKLATGIAIVFFLSSTGVFTYLTGGYNPQLHLNNSGAYFDNFYVHTTDVASLNWLSLNMQAQQNLGFYTQLQTDSYAANARPDLLQYPLTFGIYPKLIQKNSYVFLSYTNIINAQGVAVYNSDQFSYTYPIQFFDENKDLLYDNGSARIYR